MGRKEKTLLYGTLDILILKAVSSGPLHGYRIGRWLRETSEGRIQVEEGSLYPALHRLDQKGYLKSEWGRSEFDRRVKCYILTDQGRKRLAREDREWADFVKAVGLILGATRRPDWAPDGS